MTMSVQDALKQVSMSAANFGNAETFKDVVQDWFKFLGGKPGEVVVVDGGSSPQTHAVYWDLFQNKFIDKLQVIRKEHPDNNKNTCYYQEIAAGAICTNKYILWFKSDTLPFRQGHDDWLPEAIEHLRAPRHVRRRRQLQRPQQAPRRPVARVVLQRQAQRQLRHHEAAELHGRAGRVRREVHRLQLHPPQPHRRRRQGEHPVRHRDRHGAVHEEPQPLHAGAVEDDTWTVFHTNVVGPSLVKVREDYLARKNVRKFMNAGRVIPLQGGCYYGRPRDRWKEIKVAFGASPLGPAWRAVKRLVKGKPATA